MISAQSVSDEIRDDYKGNVAFLHREEEGVIAHIDHWSFNKTSNEEAVRLMDTAREYNTKHHGIKYPPRPRDCILIMPRTGDRRLLVAKAADYLRQYYNENTTFSLQDSEERIVFRINEWPGFNMDNDEAVRLLDDARAYNRERYKIEYQPRPAGNVVITPDQDDRLMLVQKIADCMRQAYDASRPETLPDVEKRIIDDLEYDVGYMTGAEAQRLLDDARGHNTEHYGIQYPER